MIPVKAQEILDFWFKETPSEKRFKKDDAFDQTIRDRFLVVDGKATFNFNKKTDYLKLSKYFIIFLSVITFIVASKGYDILYLFLLADLFCCAFVLTVFLSFYQSSCLTRLIHLQKPFRHLNLYK